MSSEIAIRVSGISKCFNTYDRPKDRLKQSLLGLAARLAPNAALRQRLQQRAQACARNFWALNDINFEVKKGETVGIIGRNGSGKSTLLQIICGTLSPTMGQVEVKGRVAALLELGSGFNPEYTGRENVYLNGQLLGLTREQVDQRFDSIAAFADIGDFIDQPVKVYSSGMYVRLAFAVIANVDADILVIDEALAVGDAIFTQKCMRYIRDFQERGTLLFVSHDTGSVLNLCQHGLWLGHGTIQRIGSSTDVVEAYLQYTLQETYGDAALLSATSDGKKKVERQPKPLEEPSPSLLDYQAKVTVKDNFSSATGWQTGAAELVSIQLDRLDTGPEGMFQGGEKVCVRIRARALQALDRPIIGFLVRDRLGQDLFGENTLPFTHLKPSPVQPNQEFIAEFVFRLPMLPNGEYAVMASVADGDRHDNVQHHYLHNALILNVTSSKIRYGLTGIQFEEVLLKQIA